MPAVILAKAGNVGIQVLSRHSHSIPVLRRFDKLVSPPLNGHSDGLEERQLDTAQGAIYNEGVTIPLNLPLFQPLLNSLARSLVTLIDRVREVVDPVV